MRVSLLICAAVWMAAMHSPAAADCLEDVEAIELAALQGDEDLGIGDTSKTPTERGRATFSKPVQDHLREAERAAKHGNEIQCTAVLQTALRLMSGF